MNSITYEFQPAPTLEVNGHSFALQMSDVDIFERAAVIGARYQDIGAQSSNKQILKAIRECCGFVDEMLGEGAMKTIADGKPVRLHDALAVMNLVARAAAKSYVEKLESYD